MPSIKDLIKYAIKNMIDELNKFVFILFVIFFVVSLFVKSFFVDIIKILLLIVFILRLVSKDKSKRYKENEVFLKVKKAILHPFKSIKKSDRDKNSVYKKCHKCKTVLKLPLPKKRGINHAKCPRCGKRLTIINFRKKKAEKVKVEVIKKKRG